MNYAVDMFSIPLIHISISDWKSTKKEIKKLYSQSDLTIDSLEKVKSDFYSEKKYNKKIQNIFYKEIKALEQMIGEKKFFVSNAWIETSEKNMFHQVHNHGPIGFSAVCFVDYDENLHSPTQFVSPFNNYLNGSIVSHSPDHISEGSILFFPSMIHHYTIPNDSDTDRTILSFNLS